MSEAFFDGSAIFRGDMDAAEGEFSGEFSAGNVDALSQINIADGAVSTYVFIQGSISQHLAPNAVWGSYKQIQFHVPTYPADLVDIKFSAFFQRQAIRKVETDGKETRFTGYPFVSYPKGSVYLWVSGAWRFYQDFYFVESVPELREKYTYTDDLVVPLAMRYVGKELMGKSVLVRFWGDANRKYGSGDYIYDLGIIPKNKISLAYRMR